MDEDTLEEPLGVTAPDGDAAEPVAPLETVTRRVDETVWDADEHGETLDEALYTPDADSDTDTLEEPLGVTAPDGDAAEPVAPLETVTRRVDETVWDAQEHGETLDEALYTPDADSDTDTLSVILGLSAVVIEELIEGDDVRVSEGRRVPEEDGQPLPLTDGVTAGEEEICRLLVIENDGQGVEDEDVHMEIDEVREGKKDAEKVPEEVTHELEEIDKLVLVDPDMESEVFELEESVLESEGLAEVLTESDEVRENGALALKLGDTDSLNEDDAQSVGERLLEAHGDARAADDDETETESERVKVLWGELLCDVLPLEL
jgi:hypothetical protein